MKLGIINGYEKDDFIQVKEYGLEFIEICLHSYEAVDDFLTKQKTIKKSIEETGVNIGSIGIWGMDHINSDGTSSEKMLNKELELIGACAALGCESYVTGCNYIDGRSYLQNCLDSIKHLERLLARGKEKNVRISVYNCSWNNFIYDDLAWTVILGHLPDLYIKYDISHCLSRKGDYLSEILKWGGRFGHIHLKGSLLINGEYIDAPPAGMDSINWGAVFSALHNVGYNYLLSIEPHSHIWSGELGEKGILYTIEYMKKFIL